MEHSKALRLRACVFNAAFVLICVLVVLQLLDYQSIRESLVGSNGLMKQFVADDGDHGCGDSSSLLLIPVSSLTCLIHN